MVATLPAFTGANFDSSGSCLHHPEVKLTQKTTIDGGRVVFKELRRRCPQCSAIPSTPPRSKKKSSSPTFPEIKRHSNSMHSYHSHGSISANTQRRENRRPISSNASSAKLSPNSSLASPNPNSSLARPSSRSRSRARSKSPSSPREQQRAQSRSRSPFSSSRNNARSKSPSAARGATGSSSVAASYTSAELNRAPRARSRSRSARSKSPAPRSRSRSGGQPSSSSSSRSRAESKNPNPKLPKPKKEFDTPFNSKGRCHYHSNTQLAKKKLTGGWKLLLSTCPRCIEDKYNNDNSDNRSVASRRSTKSSRSVQSSGGGGSGGRKRLPSMKKNKSSRQYECPFDNQGYCHRHSHVRLAKKKLTGGWKILQQFCIECVKQDYDDQKHDDNRSVCSRSSRLSRKSAVSRISRKSTISRKPAAVGSSKSKRPSSQTGVEGETDSELSTSQSEQNQKKVVKKMNYTDDDGEEGVYTGYVNSNYKPHGSGKMVYNNGKRFSGEWCEGTTIHGKTTGHKQRPKKKDSKKDKMRDRSREPASKADSSKNGTSSSSSINNGSSVRATSTTTEQDKESKNEKQKKQEALREYKNLYNTKAQVVKNMLFVDFYGDRGRYTGEVDDKTMPHGVGAITYDHGLVQEGKWTNGVLDEDNGSTTSGPKNSPQRDSREGMARERKSSSSFRRRARSKDP